MIRPCDACGGGGIIPRTLESVGGRCPHCEEMPWLRPGMFRDWYTDQDMMYPPRWALDSQRVKPDPDTVMRWNFTLNVPADEADELMSSLPSDDIGWVASLVRLEVAE